ncbi:hypothetical protein SS05631_c33740 [Sinorhizobium sp. CCBAU 05631]|nr:hypothetical protein SS05631_c33740 [Sinorhizobium sp. CCBAU 05631]
MCHKSTRLSGDDNDRRLNFRTPHELVQGFTVGHSRFIAECLEAIDYIDWRSDKGLIER